MSKLYTEEQVIKLTKAAYAAGENHNKFIFKMELNNLTPIELPTDEEIHKESDNYVDNDHVLFVTNSRNSKRYGFSDGAKWMRDKINGGNNE